MAKVQSLTDRLQARQLPTVEVEAGELGTVTLMALSMRHRLYFHNKEHPASQCSYGIALIALCLSENGRRLADQLDFDDVVSLLDGINDVEFTALYNAASDLNKTTAADEAQAEKN